MRIPLSSGRSERATLNRIQILLSCAEGAQLRLVQGGKNANHATHKKQITPIIPTYFSVIVASCSRVSCIPYHNLTSKGNVLFKGYSHLIVECFQSTD